MNNWWLWKATTDYILGGMIGTAERERLARECPQAAKIAAPLDQSAPVEYNSKDVAPQRRLPQEG